MTSPVVSGDHRSRSPGPGRTAAPEPAPARHALVIGKFYPPHAGHLHLIDTARAACERVTVVVMAAACESVPLEQRVTWLRDTYRDTPQVEVVGVSDDVEVDYGSPTAWDAHVALMEAALARATVRAGRPSAHACVDLVVTSEPYGAELAHRLGARELCVDRERSSFPVSGTAVRADPVAHWSHLPAAVRGGLARRVVVLGAESTGTTTVSTLLAERLRARGGVWAHTRWVPEYGREYTLRKLEIQEALADRAGRQRPDMTGLVWTTEDFTAVAQEQRGIEDRCAAQGSPVLVCDTDALATAVWHLRYLGTHSEVVEREGARRPADLYLLTDHVDVPFVQDGIRDGEHLRAWMTSEFVDVLRRGGHRWRLLRGPVERRVEDALAAVDALLREGWEFTDPLG